MSLLVYGSDEKNDFISVAKLTERRPNYILFVMGSKAQFHSKFLLVIGEPSRRICTKTIPSHSNNSALNA